MISAGAARILPAVLITVITGTAAACTHTTVEQQVPPMAPTLTLERFLRAANAQDLDTMAQLFGTREGSVLRLYPDVEVDRWMDLISTLLRHNDYSIGSEQIVPGRRAEATLFTVTMAVGEKRIPVPFTLVRNQDAWLVEQIGLESITSFR